MARAILYGEVIIKNDSFDPQLTGLVLLPKLGGDVCSSPEFGLPLAACFEQPRPVSWSADMTFPTAAGNLPGVEAYTVDRFCAAFGVGKTYVYEQIKTKKLRAVKTGARTLILRRDAEAWVSALPPMGSARHA